MSKYTKVIAALGVAAGLGVASLPLGAFAANPSVGGTVNVQTTVPDVLTMKIDNSAVIDATAAGANIGTGTSAGITDITIGTDGKIAAGKGGESESSTTIVINTNQPNGYDFKVWGTDLEIETAGLNDKIAPFSTPTAIKESGAVATDEGWGINVTVAAQQMKEDGSAMEDITGSYNMSGAENFSAKDSGNNKYYMPGTAAANAATIDAMENNDVVRQREVTYTIKYGANVQGGKRAGVYKGTATYTATAR